MKSNKPTYIPNELASAVPGGAVVSADGVKDYNLDMSQEEINGLVLGNAFTYSLKITPSVAYIGSGTILVTIAATSNPPSIVKVTRNGVNVEGNTFNEPISTAGTSTYVATFTRGGINKTATATFKSVNKIHFGALESETPTIEDLKAMAAYQPSTPPTTVAREYNISLTSTRQFIYFLVPKVNMTNITSVAMGRGSASSPVEGGYVTSLEDNDYKVWKSTNGYTGAGTQVFTVN